MRGPLGELPSVRRQRAQMSVLLHSIPNATFSVKSLQSEMKGMKNQGAKKVTL